MNGDTEQVMALLHEAIVSGRISACFTVIRSISIRYFEGMVDFEATLSLMKSLLKSLFIYHIEQVSHANAVTLANGSWYI
jgi:hypothetical protein